ncbi:MAG TPA: hypothetical protein PKA64_17110 [Myxococcota bacterium]|nr:hypothetical protein [Myxococcota bacterium]
MNDDNATPFSDTRFDVRVIEHAIRRGTLTRAEVDAELATLDDEAEFAVESSVRFHAGVADRGSRGRR